MAYYLYVLAVEATPEEADALERQVASVVRKAGLEPAPCNWTPDRDTVTDGLRDGGAADIDYDDLFVRDMNPPAAV